MAELKKKKPSLRRGKGRPVTRTLKTISPDGTPTEIITNVNEPIPIERLIELRNKRLSYEEIGRIVGCSKINVWSRIHGWIEEQEEVEEYKKNESHVLNLIRFKITKSITDDDIKKAPLRDRIVAFGVLYDKYRLETDQSTANVGYKGEVIAAVASLQELKSLESKLSDPGNVPDSVQVE